MTLQELKQKIETKNIVPQFFIFQYSDNTFLPIQYYREIAAIQKLEVETLQEIPSNSFSLFNETLDTLQIYFIDKLEKQVVPRDNLIIICKSITKELEEPLGSYVIKFPKLEDWQIEDYVYSLLEGVDEQLIQKFYSTIGNNIYRLDRELQKLEGCSVSEKQFYLNKMFDENAFSDISNYAIFDLSNAILKKEIQKIKDILVELDNIDVEPIGLLTILCNNFKNIIKVQLASNPTAESVGVPSKQFWAIKYSCGIYTKEQLIKIYSFLTDLDRRIKIGELPVSILIDYMITKVLTI